MSTPMEIQLSAQVIELRRHIDILTPQARLVDDYKQELDEVGLAIGCDHIENLANCVRQTIDAKDADLARLTAENALLKEQLLALIAAATKFTIGCNCQGAKEDDALADALDAARDVVDDARKGGNAQPGFYTASVPITHKNFQP